MPITIRAGSESFPLNIIPVQPNTNAHKHRLLIENGIVAGYICAVILQSIIKRLKKVENFAAEKSEILLSRGTVSNAIPKGGVGAVSILLSTGSNVTYPAKAEDGEPIKQDKEVNILRFDGDYIIVESTSRLEDKYSGR